MPVDPHANFAYSTVATAPSPATSGGSLVVQSGEGSRFPSGTFNATVWPAGTSPTASNAEIVRATVSGDTFTITRTQEGTSARAIVVGDQIAATATAKMFTDIEQSILAGFCGDGSDGNVTISGTTTLTRDMWYDTLTVQSGGILDTAGYRVFCKTLCQVDSGGTIRRNGVDATSATGATAPASATLGGGQAGANGATTAGASTSSVNNAFGGQAGAGGAGASGAGGGAGAATIFGNPGQARMLPQAAVGNFMGGGQNVAFSGGTGGGGGGGDAVNSGGGGGSGGGVVIINARAVINNGSITATGGAGRSVSTGNTGGGGGGGGGVVIINTTSFTGTQPTAAGGAGGTKNGTGVNGTAGSTGKVLVNTWL